MNELIKLIDIEKSYGAKKVLEKINLTVARGSIVGLIGQTGSGKSTLAKTMAGLVKADKGKVLYQGKEIGVSKRRDFSVCADIQYIFQDAYGVLESSYTIGSVLDETVTLCRLNKREEVLRPEMAMELVGLDYSQWKNQRVRLLSGGQRQKLCIARALIPNPALIVADESTAMLDPRSNMEVYELLNKMKNQHGIAVLLITHQSKVIKEICDYLYVLHEGRIIESGQRSEVILTPKREYTKKLVACINYFGGV